MNLLAIADFQTATHGFACEILFAVARMQSSGKFWRVYGPAICKLMDINLISSATSLKQWIEPCRDELANETGIKSLHHLVQKSRFTFFFFYLCK